jgi:hypothetical protein
LHKNNLRSWEHLIPLKQKESFDLLAEPKKFFLRPETESDIEAHYRYTYANANTDNHFGMKFYRIIIGLEISHQAS